MENRVLKVAVVGAESTGKTTLCETLAKEFGTRWVAEFGRQYVDRMIAANNGDRDNLTFVEQDFINIAERQLEMEDAALQEASQVLFCDSTLLTTALWCQFLLSGTEKATFALPPALAELEALRQSSYDLYLLADIDVCWVDDGSRLAPDTKWFHGQFHNALVSKKLPFEVISGRDWSKRTRQAIGIVQALLHPT